MLRDLLICATLCAAPTTVMAGDRDKPLAPALAPDLVALLHNDHAARPVVPGRRTPAVPPKSFVSIAYRGVEARQLPQLEVTPVETVRLHPVFALEQLHSLPSWHLAVDDPAARQITSMRGGDWAVRDTLKTYGKRGIRRTAFTTMLMFRLDGDDASDSLSVGGGGVAAALWRAVPGN